MAYNLIMLVVAMLVAAAMAVTVLWFFRRLREIEKDRRQGGHQ